MHPMWWVWGGGGIVMMLFILLFWGMVIAGLVVGIRWLVTQGRASGTDSAMQILRERYARGDISREEFEAKRRDLGPVGFGVWQGRALEDSVCVRCEMHCQCAS